MSHKCSFATLGHRPFSSGLSPPTQTNESRARISARRCRSGVWGRMRSPAQNRRRPPATRHACVHYKKIKKIRKKGNYDFHSDIVAVRHFARTTGRCQFSPGGDGLDSKKVIHTLIRFYSFYIYIYQLRVVSAGYKYIHGKRIT